ncbi:MAG: DUF3866 family protein [Acidimicrobiales bacterium]
MPACPRPPIPAPVTADQPPQPHRARRRAHRGRRRPGPGLDPLGDRHRWHRIDPGPVADVLHDAGLEVTTMGRTVAEDPLYFAAAGAAGVLAATLGAP